MPSDLPPKPQVRWWLVLALAVLGGVLAMFVAMCTVSSSIDAVSNEFGELRVSAFGIPLHRERGPMQPLEQKMLAYGLGLIGGYTVSGLLLGAVVGTFVRRPLT